MARACEHFVEPGSKEAHELRRAHLVLVSTPLPTDDEEVTVEIDPPTDAQLLSEWRSGRGER